MARPMLLIRKPLMLELFAKYKDGVPVSKLIAQYNLNLTPPTLTKLLMFVMAADEAKDDVVGELINASLYPEWLASEPPQAIPPYNQDVCIQSYKWKYVGTMPLGEWVENDWSEA